MLDELDEDVDTTHSRLRATQKKVRHAAGDKAGVNVGGKAGCRAGDKEGCERQSWCLGG